MGCGRITTAYRFPALDTIPDVLCAAIDPHNPAHCWMGSWGKGLVEINNGACTNVYNNSNSPLQSKVEYQWVGVGGLAYDTTGNLWIINFTYGYGARCL